jgi:acetylornithine deacetylase
LTIPAAPDPAERVDRVRRIADAVERHRDDLVGFLQTLVRVPSQTGHEGAVQELVAARMRADGLDPQVWEPDVAALAPYADQITAVDSYAGRPNVVGRLPGAGGVPSGSRSLILNAHIDTVEAGDPARWTHPPFSAAIVDGNLYGRGACDMKAGLATHLVALAAVRAAGYRPRGDIVVQSTISEEDGGAGALAAVLRGDRADGAIITEPTGLAVVPAQGGSLMFRLRVPGRSAHAAVRDEGVSAIEKFALLHRALLAFETRRNRTIAHPLYAPIANKIPVNIGVVRGGSWPSSVPEWLVAEGRAGLVPGEVLAVFRDQVAAEIARAAAGDDWLRDNPPTIEWIDGQFSPAEVPVDAPLVRLLQDAHAAVTGAPPAVEAATYGADMRHFILTGATPCVMYGAGDVRLAHHADERVPLADLLTATKTIALAITDWCGADDRA